MNRAERRVVAGTWLLAGAVVVLLVLATVSAGKDLAGQPRLVSATIAGDCSGEIEIRIQDRLCRLYLTDGAASRIHCEDAAEGVKGRYSFKETDGDGRGPH